MMKPSKFGLLLAVGSVLTVVPGCKDFFNVNVNPLSPSSVGVYSLLPATQVTMAENLGDNIGGLSQYTMALMQQLYNTRNIGNFQQTGDSFSGPWGGLYRGTLVNSELIISQGSQEQHWDYVGIAQLQKAYVVSQMVDLWGDIPYSEALMGVANTAPHFDKAEDIYNGNGSIKGLFTLIDEGIANLAKPSTPTVPSLGQVDLIYKGDLAKWARFGRTLKLKLYNQLRKTNSAATVQSQIAPLLASQLMEETGDFQLDYFSSVTPDNRNPGYVSDYSLNPENKIGRYFYEDMFILKDPRRPYYFFNQIAKHPTQLLTGQDYVSRKDSIFVTVRPGSTGLFVSLASTASFQTVQGLYPIGGRYDDGKGGSTGGGAVGKAQAPQRLLTYYSRKFTEAELRLMVLNTPNSAGIALKEGVVAAMRKVNTIAVADGSSTISSGAIQVYADSVMVRYNDVRTLAAGTIPASVRPTTTEEKLEVIMYEKYVASFGYGVDVYTDFRRTHHPRIHVSQQAVDPALGLLPDDGATQANGKFPRRFLYPTNDLILNPNSPRVQPDPSTPIFWER